MPAIPLKICNLNSLLTYLFPIKKEKLPSFNPAPVACPVVEELGHDLVAQMDAAELARVFQMFDQNGDGRITAKELNDSLASMGIVITDKELNQMIERVDANGDGCVDIDEFEELYRSIMEERDEEKDMREAFNVFDQNGDGYITVDELQSMLVTLGVGEGRAADDECRLMIKRVDADGDGRVNFAEFKQMMRGGGGFAALKN